MPTLQIRNLPIELYQTLKALAIRERRSLNSQATILLQEALSSTQEDARTRRKALTNEIRAHSAQFSHLNEVDVVAWIREDRDR